VRFRTERSRESVLAITHGLHQENQRLTAFPQAVLHRPERIEVTSTQTPFRQFSLTWLFETASSASCRVSVLAQIQMQSSFIQHLVDRILSSVVEDVVAAFEARLHEAYADPAEAQRSEVSPCNSAGSRRP
jgi:ribosome-associated toxin RatA of RatAB toxin-antitoxin module